LTYEIVITAAARLMLDFIGFRTAACARRFAMQLMPWRLSQNKGGKPLVGDLKGYRSVRAVGQRYRIIYRVSQLTVTVAVVALGIRKGGSRDDIYTLAQKLVKLGLL
jgi:mRNA interferase RelE/StbE